jgi:hypothetical protein
LARARLPRSFAARLALRRFARMVRLDLVDEVTFGSNRRLRPEGHAYLQISDLLIWLVSR